MPKVTRFVAEAKDGHWKDKVEKNACCSLSSAIICQNPIRLPDSEEFGASEVRRHALLTCEVKNLVAGKMKL